MGTHSATLEVAAAALREAIARSGLTTAQIIAKVGCTRKSLSNWRGGQRPSDFYIGKLSEVLGTNLWRMYVGERPVHAASRPLAQGTRSETDRLSVGGMSIDWTVIALDRFRYGQIRTTYDRTPIPLPADLRRLRDAYQEEWEARMAAGAPGLPFNSPLYKLTEFFVGYRDLADGEEVPILRLRFGPTDYFTQIVTDLNVGDAARDRYARAVNVAERPVPEFASIAAVNLNVITADGYLVVSERSLGSFFAPGQLHTSVAEHMQRPNDAGTHGAPDPFRAAARGAREELGVEVDEREVEFCAFGVQPELCQYSLMGTQRISLTRDELLRLRAFGTPKDKWESRTLVFVPFELDAVARIVHEQRDRWLHLGLAAVVLGLWQAGHTFAAIDEAFSRHA